MRESQILQAATLGTLAFQRGVKAAPCLDRDFLPMLAGRKIGQTPAGEASTLEIMAAWSKAWHAANLAAEIS